APQMPEMDDLCNAMPPKGAPAEEQPDFSFCPEVRYTQPSGLIRPDDGGSFCICPGPPDQEVRDLRRITGFEIYAEDGDVRGDKSEDTLYGVLLLDPDPLSSTPHNAAAYRTFWEPCGAGERISVSENKDGDRTGPPVGRESSQVTVFKLDDGSAYPPELDLCNNNSGESLTPGLHDLQFMVTDRPFFRPPELQGADRGADGEPKFVARQCGVPDLAAGATYAVIDYVFECVDSAIDPPDCVQVRESEDDPRPICTCNCATPESN
ncbi:MAG TPA: hypothetical protein VFG69_09490, partial [Nannocystaceae bacterium]|nr:hypothetical protein [Nannocystaceae bacterium]